MAAEGSERTAADLVVGSKAATEKAEDKAAAEDMRAKAELAAAETAKEVKAVATAAAPAMASGGKGGATGSLPTCPGRYWWC